MLHKNCRVLNESCVLTGTTPLFEVDYSKLSRMSRWMTREKYGFAKSGCARLSATAKTISKFAQEIRLERKASLSPMLFHAIARFIWNERPPPTRQSHTAISCKWTNRVKTVRTVQAGNCSSRNDMQMALTRAA